VALLGGAALARGVGALETDARPAGERGACDAEGERAAEDQKIPMLMRDLQLTENVVTRPCMTSPTSTIRRQLPAR
jgi:hypothetical protein